MSNDVVVSKIELLEEQIENLERSGYFTEKEMDRLTAPKYVELENLRRCLQNVSQNAGPLAVNLNAISKAMAACALAAPNARKNIINNIKVNNPIILTQNITQK